MVSFSLIGFEKFETAPSNSKLTVFHPAIQGIEFWTEGKRNPFQAESVNMQVVIFRSNSRYERLFLFGFNVFKEPFHRVICQFRSPKTIKKSLIVVAAWPPLPFA
ncbi:MAG: hypothetical protein A2X49_15970 [Lentisphaerae bacterium GWF2_52_8]|nr:MAG: hypothetical protein A2X49_15970 [Lentisphaerae bacterium GWF2_52_8]